MQYKSMWIIGAVLIAVVVAIYMIQSPSSPTPGGPIVASVIVPNLSEAEKQGEALFNANCASCHGANGAGQEGVAPPFVHRIYQPGHHGDGAFFSAAQIGVRAHHWSFGDMPPVEGVTQQDVGQIVTYIRALQRANGI